MQPGTTITPGGEDNPPQPAETPQNNQPAPSQTPQLAQTPTPVPPTPTPEAQPSRPQADTPPSGNWQFTTGDQQIGEEQSSYELPSIEPISWTASEYIDHEKNRSWFLAIGGATIVIAAIAFLLTRDILSIVIIIVAGILLAVSAARKPHTLSFQLNDQGLQVGSRFYPFASFKSFTVLEEGALSSIQLLPARRFMPSLSIYYPPDQEDSIIASLGSFLPHEERKRDAVDSLMRRIKF